jgi:lipoprotein-releasing system permease protein
VLVYKIGGDFGGYDDAAKRLGAVPGVRHVLPVIEGQVIASTPVQALGAKVRGMSEDGVKALTIVANNVHAGTFDGFDAQDGIAIGTRLANLLRVNIGDTVTLISPRGATTPFGTAPRIKPPRWRCCSRWAWRSSTAWSSCCSEAQRFFSGDAVDV